MELKKYEYKQNYKKILIMFLRIFWEIFLIFYKIFKISIICMLPFFSKFDKISTNLSFFLYIENNLNLKNFV